MSTDQPAPAPGAPVKRGNLTIRDMTGVPTHPATGKHRVVNSCRAGHEETIEVRTQADLIEAMIAACGVCGGLVNVSRHVNGAGIELGMILVLDPKTPPDNPEAAR